MANYHYVHNLWQSVWGDSKHFYVLAIFWKWKHFGANCEQGINSSHNSIKFCINKAKIKILIFAMYPNYPLALKQNGYIALWVKLFLLLRSLTTAKTHDSSKGSYMHQPITCFKKWGNDLIEYTIPYICGEKYLKPILRLMVHPLTKHRLLIHYFWIFNKSVTLLQRSKLFESNPNSNFCFTISFLFSNWKFSDYKNDHIHCSMIIAVW